MFTLKLSEFPSQILLILVNRLSYHPQRKCLLQFKIKSILDVRNSNKFNYIFQMPSAKLYEHQINIFNIICERVFVCTFNILQCSLDYTCYFLSLSLLFVQSIKNIFKEFFFDNNKKKIQKIAILSKIVWENCVRGKVGYKNVICILLNSNWAYCVICKFITAQMVRSHSPLHIYIYLARFSSTLNWMNKKKRICEKLS